jgi:hypothetical protein
MARWNPPNYQDISRQLEQDPSGTGRSLDQTLQILNRQVNAIPQFFDNLVPRGAIDGSNQTFILPSTPNPASLHVYADGLRTTAYRLVNLTLTMTVAPTTTLIVDYRSV